MTMRTRLILALSVLLAALLGNLWLWLQHQPLPQIQGTFISNAKTLENFQLLDDQQQPFQRADLQGQWHLLAYGFTHCPDYCPTLLHELVKLERTLKQRPEALQILFYSVDQQRDTSAQLAQYLDYFSEDFIGLRAGEDAASTKAFEQSLGIIYQLESIADTAQADGVNYSVAHGTSIYLLNPEGKLQAVLQPDTTPSGIALFSANQLLQDYLTVRDYMDHPSTNNKIAARASQH